MGSWGLLRGGLRRSGMGRCGGGGGWGGRRVSRWGGNRGRGGGGGGGGGGPTPFVHGALRRARELGAKTIFLSCVQPVANEPGVDVVIRPLTGAEVVTGSTRLKAGTATKLVLNMISTLAM